MVELWDENTREGLQKKLYHIIAVELARLGGEATFCLISYFKEEVDDEGNPRDGASGDTCIPLVTPSTLLLSSRGRVKLCQSSHPYVYGYKPPAHLAGYLAPEYRPNKHYSDTEAEKMWIYSLGETLKRAALTSHAATTRLSSELCQMLADMTRIQVAARASLMHLLDVISEYCKRRQQNRPFSHIVMDLHQEAMAAIESTLDTPWGPPAMPEIIPRTRNNRTDQSSEGLGTIPRRWMGLTRNRDLTRSRLTKEASTSMEDLSFALQTNAPGTVVRPKSMCVPVYNSDERHYQFRESSNNYYSDINLARDNGSADPDNNYLKMSEINQPRPSNLDNYLDGTKKRLRMKRNPVQRAASRLYRAESDIPKVTGGSLKSRECVGPEFVIRAALPHKQLHLPDTKSNVKKSVTVIMLNGQKLDVICNPSSTTAGQLFELIIQKEKIEDNFMLGISALIAGDFVFLPSDTRISKAIQPGNDLSHGVTLTLFLRVRFFLPNLRCIRSSQARQLLYLQLRRSILEHQLPCSFSQLIELDGLALQAEFGDYNEREHGVRDYFLLEHYAPETMCCAVDDERRLRQELVEAHKAKKGVDIAKAESEFIALAQTLPHYGGHFYTATWVLKDNNLNKNVWLYISSQGINLFERGKSTSNCGPQLYEMFEWRSIQTLCYSKHYLCVLPHPNVLYGSKVKKYKLKMDHKKSYFAFRLASLHHQFFLRLRTEYTSLQTLSQQFGIPLKDMKNESNSLCKFENLTSADYITLDQGTVNAETEFKIKFCASPYNGGQHYESIRRRSRSVNDFLGLRNEDSEDEVCEKENNKPTESCKSLILDSYLCDFPLANGEKRRGVKMGTRAISNFGPRISRSMETVNAMSNDHSEHMSLQSESLNYCSSPSVPSRSPIGQNPTSDEAYILDSSIKSGTNLFLPNFHESISESLMNKFESMPFEEERVLSSVIVPRDFKGNLGLQITEGSDGNVYIQSVINGGPAELAGKIFSGDQVVAVDGKNLLGLKYNEALNVLKNTGRIVEFIVSRNASTKPNVHTLSTLRVNEFNNIKSKIDLSNINETHLSKVCLDNTMRKLRSITENSPRYNHFEDREIFFDNNYNNNICESPVEKHLTENCCDVSNSEKYRSQNASQNTTSDVPYHKHIRYEIEPEKDNLMSVKKLQTPKCSDSIQNTSLNRTRSKSCNNIYNSESDNNRAVVVGVIPKKNAAFLDFHSLDRKILKHNFNKNEQPVIALPRSLGLSRKWRGPVRYPVTPVKKLLEDHADCDCISNSDDEQVFI